MSRRSRKNKRELVASSHATPQGNKSKDNFFCHSCGKKIYPMEFEARAMSQHLIEQGNIERLEVYPCPHGMGFHLTSR